MLFVGLACDVAGVKRYVGSRNISDDNLFTVDLICQGPHVSLTYSLISSRTGSKISIAGYELFS